VTAECLRYDILPTLGNGRLVLAFSGWMDGGDVSTGTVEWLITVLDAHEVARIDPEGFYIYNFPGSMEVSALFRPHTRIVDGAVRAFDPPHNCFYSAPEQNLLLFRGREPHLNWNAFADAIFELTARTGITRIYFVGSFGGTVPHTREPRLWCTVSDDALKAELMPYGVSFTTYDGPAGFATQLVRQARDRGVQMVNVVAEIPAYIQGTNPKAIDAGVRFLAAVLNLTVPLGRLRELSAVWEDKVNEVLERKPELVAHIRKLEEDYDNEVFDTQMGELKEWLERQGIRVD
jgi:predicted ATP-grasp superfamily ATP-dependent carboligase